MEDENQEQEAPVEEEKVEEEEEKEEEFDLEPETREEVKEEEPEKKEDPETYPDDEELISKVTSKKIGPLEKKLDHLATVSEVDAFIQSQPEYSKYRATMIKHATHPAYSKIPVSFIANALASKDQQKIGAAKERAAQKKVDETKGAGKGTREVAPGETDWRKVSNDAFEKKRAEILGRL